MASCVCFTLILPIYYSFNSCSCNFSKFRALHVYWLHFMFTCECFLQDLKNGLYSDWTAKMLCCSCLVPRILGTNAKYKKCSCVLHPTTEIVSENHSRTEALVGILRGFCLKYPPVWQGIIVVDAIFQTLHHTLFTKSSRPHFSCLWEQYAELHWKTCWSQDLSNLPSATLLSSHPVKERN